MTARPDEVVAWLHTMLRPDDESTSERLSMSMANPFGKRGVDYDPSYIVTHEPMVRLSALQSANARLAEAETAFSAALITVGNQDEQIAVLTERLAAAEHALTQTFDFPDDTFERGDDELFIITVTGRHLKLVHEAIRRAAAGEGDASE